MGLAAFNRVRREQAVKAQPVALKEDKPLEKMTVPELKALAKAKGIEGCDNMKKAELLAALEVKADDGSGSAGDNEAKVQGAE